MGARRRRPASDGAPSEGQAAARRSAGERQDHPGTVDDRRLRATIQAANVGLWDWDLRANTVYFSPEWKRQIGYEDHEIGNDFAEWEGRVHPDDLESTLAAVRTFIERPRPDYHTEFRFRHRDGSYRWILAQAAVEHDARGRPVRLLGSHVDVTERKRADEALRGAERRQATILEAISDGFVALDRDWHYTYVNRKAGDMFGRRPEDLVGKHIWTEFPEGQDQPFHLAYERAMAEGVPQTIESYYPPWNRWFENRIYPFEGGLAIYFTDVTRRRRAEAMLMGQNRVLEMVARGIPLGEVLEVCDDGCGIAEEALERTTSIGLVGMRERALSVGGTVSIARRAFGGTVVAAELPGT